MIYERIHKFSQLIIAQYGADKWDELLEEYSSELIKLMLFGSVERFLKFLPYEDLGLETFIDDIIAIFQQDLDDEQSSQDRNAERAVEIEYLKAAELSAKSIARRYIKSKPTKNGFSTKELYEFLGGTGDPKEITMAEYIYNKIT